MVATSSRPIRTNYLAYEQCDKITGGSGHCMSAHEPLTYTDKTRIKNLGGFERRAECGIALGPGQRSRKP